MTSKHPERSVAAALAKLDAEKNPKLSKKGTEDDLGNEEEDEDQPVMNSNRTAETKDKLDSQLEEDKKEDGGVTEKDL